MTTQHPPLASEETIAAIEAEAERNMENVYVELEHVCLVQVGESNGLQRAAHYLRTGEWQ